MTDNPEQIECDIGMVGLGVMGRNFLLNIADNGFYVAGYDNDPAKVEALRRESQNRDAWGVDSLEKFVLMLRRPRAVIMLVPAGQPVDEVIKDIKPHLEREDLLIDAGNSFFKDTDQRGRKLTESGIHYLGIGISGGEVGARRGPSIMPGGQKAAYERIREIFEATAAHVNGAPCVTYLGPGSCGHFVKMVHNGIEYGLMQLISESYDIMRRGMGLNDDELQSVYTEWNEGELNSYLLEITSHIFRKVDERTGKRLIDEMLDVARQKGTGMWTSQIAMELQVPVPTIDVAVGMRNLSMMEEQRQLGSLLYPKPPRSFEGDRKTLLSQLRRALYVGMIATYAQGMSVLKEASRKFEYNLDTEAIARIWRGGCIIRAALLEDFRSDFSNDPQLVNLLLDPGLAKKIMSMTEDLRNMVSAVAQLGIPAPAMMSVLGYLDAYSSGWLPANLIQAQRDYFGAHTYERIDARGMFHTNWD